MENTNFEKKIIIIVVFSGVLLSVIQFVYNRSLWLDESYLALNIINKTSSELLKPLDHMQVAPILFLQVEKIFSDVITKSEFGLRLFPLLCFWLSLFLFYKVIKENHKNYSTIIFSLSLFVFNSTVIYFSSEVKQYMTDVLVVTSVYSLIFFQYEKEEYKYYCLGFTGAISIFLSNVSPIILFTVGCYLVFDIFRNKKKKLLLLVVISVAWASLFCFYYLIFIHNHPAREGMITEWTSYNGFMPTNPLQLEFYKFLFDKGHMIVNGLFKFGRVGGIGLSILILTGFVTLIKKRRIDIIILTITPLLLHFLLSAFKFYPIDKRLILYTCPCIIIICSFGFEYLANILFDVLKIKTSMLFATAIPLLMSLYCYRNGFPEKHIEIKENITCIEQNMNKNDTIFVNYYASIPFQYYKEISFIKIDTNNIVFGKKTNNSLIGNRWVPDITNYSNEIGSLKGRVWFLFTQIGDEGEKMRFVMNYFAAKGTRIIQEFHNINSDAYLYDISN